MFYSFIQRQDFQVFILSHSLFSIPLLFLVYSLFVCECVYVCMCENVVPVDVTLTEKIEQLEFAQVRMQNGCCYKNCVCVCVFVECLYICMHFISHVTWFSVFEHTMPVKWDVSGSTMLPFLLCGHSVPETLTVFIWSLKVIFKF